MTLWWRPPVTFRTRPDYSPYGRYLYVISRTSSPGHHGISLFDSHFGWWESRLDDVPPNTSSWRLSVTFMTRPDHGPCEDDLDVITRTSYGRLCGDLKQPLLQPVWVMKKPLRWRPGNDVQIIPITAVIWLSHERHRRTSSWHLSVTFRTRPDHGCYADDWDVITRTSYGQLFSDLKQTVSLGD